MKKFYLSISALLFYFISFTQPIVSVSTGTDLYISSGTVFFADSLILTPSSDFTITNNNLNKSATVIHPATNPYIARVYQFSNPTDLFSGTVQIDYEDGAELNGLTESSLELNVHNSTTWQVFPSVVNDTVNNYVISSSLSGILLNELTLAVSGSALPVLWRSFTAYRDQGYVLLQWSTYTEQNSNLFIIQTSADGQLWNDLASVPAAGNSNVIRNYSYLHTTPANGYNYYRIIEKDLDGKYNYSAVRYVVFQMPSFIVQILGNPVTNGILQIRITGTGSGNVPPGLKLYSADGKLLWVKQPGTGTFSINVNNYPKGTYLIRANEITLPFLIQ